MSQLAAPVQQEERLGSLDFLRGIAVLGILIINIESFCYPDPWSPYKFGFEKLIDHEVRFWVYFLGQGKFFGMFALLFGVGFYVFLERLEKKGMGLKAMDVYSRRLLWLFIIGVLHAYLIWEGDILYHYAVCGFLLFPFRSIGVRKLLLVLLVPVAVLLYNSYEQVSNTRKQYAEFTEAMAKPVDARTDEETKIITNWQRRTSKHRTDTTHVEVRGRTYGDSILTNTEHVRVHKGGILYEGILFRTLIMMLLGVILYKTGIFNDYRRLKHYWLITLLVLLAALLINYLRYYQWTFRYDDPVLSVWKNWLVFTFPKESLALAYVLLFNGLYQKYFKGIRPKLLSNVGRMALTNYITQSIVCGLIFYGYGMGMYNHLSRSELVLVVLPIWIFQIVGSGVVMRYYSQGPLEWAWRKLTYKGFSRS